MTENSRTLNSLRNFIYGISGQIVSVLLAFVARTFFIRFLSEDYLGISGLFTNILSVLSVSELGISSAITFCLYKPLAENNKDEIKAIMHFYRNAYIVIGFFVLGIGLILLPFLDTLLKDNTSLVNVRIVYLFYIMESVTSYWFFAYKATLLKADQKLYMVTVYEQILAFFRALARILMLILLRKQPEISFYIYTIIGFISNVLLNVCISSKVDKEYSFIKERNASPISAESKRSIFKNVIALFFTRVSYVVNESVDHLLITSFIGVKVEGLYTNYAYLLSVVNGMIRMFAGSMTASLGNFAVQKSEAEQFKFLKMLDLIYFWLYGFSAICFWELFNPFIKLWAGEKYLFPKTTVFIIVVYYMVPGLFSAVPAFQNAKGLFWQTRVVPIASVILNISLSVVFTAKLQWGINGILVATIISRMFIELPLTVIAVFRNAFKKSAIGYLLQYILKIFMIFGIAVVIDLLMSHLKLEGILNLSIRALTSIVVFNVIWIAALRRTEAFCDFEEMIRFIMRKSREKR